MDIRVLGPLQAQVNGRSLVPSAAKPRKVLALLLLNADRVVPTSAFQKELWGDEPPRSALTTVQTYILQLRKLLACALGGDEHAAKQVLATCSTGYMFRLGDGRRDLDIYHQLSRDGEAALLAGDNRRASELLSGALCLWQGSALVDVQAGPLLENEVLRLENSRVTVQEQRIEADLRQGHHHRLLGELAALTAEYAFNENVRAQYMLALHRCGRRREALTAYQEGRRLLIDELGLEPSPELRSLQQAILSSDPRLERRPDGELTRAGGVGLAHSRM